MELYTQCHEESFFGQKFFYPIDALMGVQEILNRHLANEEYYGLPDGRIRKALASIEAAIKTLED